MNSAAKSLHLFYRAKLSAPYGGPVFSFLSERHSSTSKQGALQSKEDKESSVTSGDNQESHSSTRNPEDRISVAQADDKLREKLESMSGEGGVAGIEYENGKPVAMKRSVRENMFRLI